MHHITFRDELPAERESNKADMNKRSAESSEESDDDGASNKR